MALPIALSIFVINPAHAAEDDFEVIVTSGQPAPGATEAFATFQRSAVKGSGEIAFQATVNGGRRGWWVFDGSQITKNASMIPGS